LGHLDNPTTTAAEPLTSQAGQQREPAQHIGKMGSWQLDHATQKLFWSDEIFRIFEISPQEFDGTYAAFLDAVHPDDRTTVHQTHMDSLTQQVSYTCIYRLVMADGRIKYAHERGETVYAAHDSPKYSLSTIQDITEQFLASENCNKRRLFSALRWKAL
jgi:PAS domain S-box-containing protein